MTLTQLGRQISDTTIGAVWLHIGLLRHPDQDNFRAWLANDLRRLALFWKQALPMLCRPARKELP